MKKAIYAFLLSILATLLFYREMPGLNVFIAQILLSLLLVVIYSRSINRSAIALWLMTTVSAAAVLVWGSFITSVFNVGCWVLLWVQLARPQASLLFSFFHGLVSLASAPMLLGEAQLNTTRKVPSRLLLSVGLSLFIVMLFFVFYRSSNPLFDLMVQKIPFPEISVPALRFLLFSFILLIGISTPRILEFFQRAEDRWKEIKISSTPDYYVLVAAWVLFGGLNLVIASMNLTDIYYLFFAAIPEAVSYSEFLHQSVNASIVSIIMAIALLVWMQRQGESDDKMYRGLKLLLYLWLLQNVVLAMLSVDKNVLYVTEYGLTHKRIGVFVYLMLCISGLLLTTWMLFRKLNTWYLLRANAWAAVGVLLLCQLVSWDYSIARFNLKIANTKDRDYLLNLTDNALPIIVQDVLENEDLYSTPQKEHLLTRCKNNLTNSSNASLLGWNVYGDVVQQSCKRYSELNKSTVSSINR